MTHDSLIITQSLQGIHSRTHHSHQNPRPPRSSPELATARVPARRLLSPSMSCKQLAALCGSGSEGRRTVCMFSARVSLIRGCWNPGVQQPWKWPADHLFFTDVETQPHSQPARWPLLHHVSHSVFRARTFPGGVDAGPLTVVPRRAPPLSSHAKGRDGLSSKCATPRARGAAQCHLPLQVEGRHGGPSPAACGASPSHSSDPHPVAPAVGP